MLRRVIDYKGLPRIILSVTFTIPSPAPHLKRIRTKQSHNQSHFTLTPETMLIIHKSTIKHTRKPHSNVNTALNQGI